MQISEMTHETEYCVRCGDCSCLYYYYDLAFLLQSLGIHTTCNVLGKVCPKCRDEIRKQSIIKFDQKLGL
jgi:hypothetical protein